MIDPFGLARLKREGDIADPDEFTWECDLAKCEKCRNKSPTEPVQEPVADDAYDKIDRFLRNNLNDEDYAEYSDALDTLYDAPPQRKPLTDEEIVDAVREADLDWQAGWTLDEHEPNRFTTLARAIERAHGIGGSND